MKERIEDGTQAQSAQSSVVNRAGKAERKRDGAKKRKSEGEKERRGSQKISIA